MTKKQFNEKVNELKNELSWNPRVQVIANPRTKMIRIERKDHSGFTGMVIMCVLRCFTGYDLIKVTNDYILIVA